MKIDGDPNVEAPRRPTPLSEFIRAVHFAADQHRDQRRKGVDASPYINHPIAVAELIASVAGVDDVTVLQAAVLHDIVEDTEVSLEEVESRFGSAVARLVEEVTDDQSLSGEARKEAQVLCARDLSRGAKLIRLSDKICNVFDVALNPPARWSVGRRRDYVEWTSKVVEVCRGVSPALEARFDQVRSMALEAIDRES
jgi:guanosine-3',5'-bis(diphosphate) 3'-pyrophosphohydrolase